VLKSSLAGFIDPMLLLPAAKLPEGNWLIELKLDGFRAVAFKASGKLSLGRETTKISIPDSEIDRIPIAQPAEPPDADPHVRWCGRGEAVRLPPIPIRPPYSSGVHSL
jgi:hypothetical protein